MTCLLLWSVNQIHHLSEDIYKLPSPLLLVFLVCGGKDFLKFRPVRLGMTSALALDAVLSSSTGHAVVGFTAPSAAVSFHHNGNKKIKLAVSNQSMSYQLDTFLLPLLEMQPHKHHWLFYTPICGNCYIVALLGFPDILVSAPCHTLCFISSFGQSSLLLDLRSHVQNATSTSLELPTFGTKTSVLN